MNGIIENETELSYKAVVRLYPVEHHYERPGETPYVKYGCQVCEAVGLKHQVHPVDTRCPNCGVNLLWE